MFQTICEQQSSYISKPFHCKSLNLRQFNKCKMYAMYTFHAFTQKHIKFNSYFQPRLSVNYTTSFSWGIPHINWQISCNPTYSTLIIKTTPLEMLVRNGCHRILMDSNPTMKNLINWMCLTHIMNTTLLWACNSNLSDTNIQSTLALTCAINNQMLRTATMLVLWFKPYIHYHMSYCMHVILKRTTPRNLR